ncbi:hypothetical protein LP419_03660 [Massilia sp. H-1]|nr:hypothetical protein LP419_03660 [Massilia sp. H-1]
MLQMTSTIISRRLSRYKAAASAAEAAAAFSLFLPSSSSFSSMKLALPAIGPNR